MEMGDGFDLEDLLEKMSFWKWMLWQLQVHLIE